MSRKIKYDYSFRKAVVAEVVKKGLSCYAVGSMFDLDKSRIRLSLNGMSPVQYRAHSEKLIYLNPPTFWGYSKNGILRGLHYKEVSALNP